MRIAQIAPGMKLAEPITNASGVTLMPAGIRLTPMFIARIKKWNIESLDVLVEKQRSGSTTQRLNNQSSGSLPAQTPVYEDENTLTAEQEAFARSVALEISRPFVNVKDNPLMMQLRAVVIKRVVADGPKGVVNVLRRIPNLNQENG